MHNQMLQRNATQVFFIFIICILGVINGYNIWGKHMGWYNRLHNRLGAAPDAQTVDPEAVLRKVESWACVKNCGACCKLGPLESRPDLESYLSPDQYNLYVSMIGPDDWCKNFNKETRLCGIYEERPEFCRVDKQNFKKMFGVEEEDFSDFSTFCCQENIADVYGEESSEMYIFEDTIEQLQEKAQ